MRLQLDTHALLWALISPYQLSQRAIEAIERTGFELLAPSAEECASFYQLPRHVQKEPFDRMLIWQCLQQSLTLATKDGDEAYKSLGLQKLW